MHVQLLTSAIAMAVISAATATEGVESDSITDVSFSKQVEDVMELTQKGDEDEQEEEEEAEEKASDPKDSDTPDMSRKESKDDKSSNFKSNKSKRNKFFSSGSASRSRSRKHPSDEWFAKGICDPDSTAKEDEDICEDIWETICNPDDVVQVADDLCDWLGFTADVGWYDGEDLDYKMDYARVESEEKPPITKQSLMTNSSDDHFTEGMCDPDKLSEEDVDVCNEVWESLCNTDDEIEVDDDFCDWFGFTADVDWAVSGDEFGYVEDEYDSYGSEDRARKNLRG
mmetsp:Transcript_24259/g.43730  ORF Transcript_24259/g.43730 Transcript_24259/m.43730 type:complete len:284 (+) Transcript_24259:209-1060(+)